MSQDAFTSTKRCKIDEAPLSIDGTSGGELVQQTSTTTTTTVTEVEEVDSLSTFLGLPDLSATTSSDSLGMSGSVPSSPSRALGPPTLYCDGAHVIRRVMEVDGKFIALKKGDHCMAPLNLARGLNASVDNFVDQLADFDLVQFHHHFLVLDNVSEMNEGEEPYVAEFTNTPDDFIHKANRVGYSAAFLDKASYKKTPLSDYKGCVIFKVIEEVELTDEERELVVQRAEKSIARSEKNKFPAYNLFMGNCEHAATEVLHAVKMQVMKAEESVTSDTTISTTTTATTTTDTMTSIPAGNIGTSLDDTAVGTVNSENTENMGMFDDNQTFDKIIETVHNTTARSSPQVTFALWNIFRFFLQVLGILFLHQINAKWGFWAAVGYSILSAAPVLMQSVANFGIVVYKLRKLLLRGSLKRGSFRHLLLKELFRCILVGFGSSLLILLMPIAVWSNYWPLSVASIVALFGFVVLNSIYSITVKAVHKVIIIVKRIQRRQLKVGSSPPSSPPLKEVSDDLMDLKKQQ